MTPYRSRTTPYSRSMAGARWLSYATGMNDQHVGKPVIGISNSCNQFVADHVHSRDLVADSVEYMVNAHCVDALACVSNFDEMCVPR